MKTSHVLALQVNRRCWRCGGMRPMVRMLHSSKPVSRSVKMNIPEPYGWMTYQCRVCAAWNPSTLPDPWVVQKIMDRITVTRDADKVQIVIQPR